MSCRRSCWRSPTSASTRSSMRSSMLDTMREDYLHAGAREGPARRRSCATATRCRTRCCPWSRLSRSTSGSCSRGAIAVETIFSWPGLGQATYDAISGPDFPMLQGLFLVFSAAVILANLLADLLYGYLDPRVGSAMTDIAVALDRRGGSLARRRARSAGRVAPSTGRDKPGDGRPGGARRCSWSMALAAPLARRPGRPRRRQHGRQPDVGATESRVHPLGTDHLGRSVLHAVAVGRAHQPVRGARGHAAHDRSSARWSASSPASSAAGPTRVLMRVTDWFLVIPFLPLGDRARRGAGPTSVDHHLRHRHHVVAGDRAARPRRRCCRCKERLYVDRARALGAARRHLIVAATSCPT